MYPVHCILYIEYCTLYTIGCSRLSKSNKNTDSILALKFAQKTINLHKINFAMKLQNIITRR